jgi:hypothetical protein
MALRQARAMGAAKSADRRGEEHREALVECTEKQTELMMRSHGQIVNQLVFLIIGVRQAIVRAAEVENEQIAHGKARSRLIRA